MARLMALLFGIAFIFAGLVGMGYFPQYNLMNDGLLLGYFEVNNIHNTIHFLTGVLAILCMFSRRLSKLFFIVIGLLYGAAAAMGFWRQGDLIVMHANLADNYLHALIAVVSLLVGFSTSSDE